MSTYETQITKAYFDGTYRHHFDISSVCRLFDIFTQPLPEKAISEHGNWTGSFGLIGFLVSFVSFLNFTQETRNRYYHFLSHNADVQPPLPNYLGGRGAV